MKLIDGFCNARLRLMFWTTVLTLPSLAATDLKKCVGLKHSSLSLCGLFIATYWHTWLSSKYLPRIGDMIA